MRRLLAAATILAGIAALAPGTAQAVPYTFNANFNFTSELGGLRGEPASFSYGFSVNLPGFMPLDQEILLPWIYSVNDLAGFLSSTTQSCGAPEPFGCQVIFIRSNTHTETDSIQFAIFGNHDFDQRITFGFGLGDLTTLGTYGGTGETMGGTYSYSLIVGAAQAVPEPASLALLGAGITGIALLRRRRARV